MRFTIRDLVLLMVIAALGLAWWADHRKQQAKFWELRAAIEDAGFSTYVENRRYYIEPMNQYQRYLSQQKKRGR